jgi:hypothetical protein
VRPSRLLAVLGVTLLAAAAWWVFVGDEGEATSGEVAPPDEPVAAPEAPPPTSFGSATDPVELRAVVLSAEQRRARQLERLASRLAEALRLAQEGRYAEALALLLEVGEQPFYPDVEDLAARLERARMEVKSYEGIAGLVATKAGPEASAEERAALERRIRATREVMARSASDADLAAFERHLARFVLGAPDAKSQEPADRLMRSFLEDRRRRQAKTPRPPVADAEAAEQRRVDELERLRQRNAVGLLDAIHASLAWLALHQAEDGSFTETACRGRCKVLKHEPACLADRGDQGKRYVVGTTALAALAFLDFRDQDVHGLFDPYLARSLTWLTKAQQADGSWFVKGSSTGQSFIYETSIVTMALAQAAGSTGLQELKDAVSRALAWLEKSQARGGGFRYGPAAPAADLSVTAWAAQAVEAARAAGIEVPPRILWGFEEFLGWTWLGEHRFSYIDGTKEHASLNPAGMLLGKIVWPVVDPAVAASWTTWLASRPPKNPLPLYTLYYGVRLSILLNNTLADPWRQWVFDIAAKKTAALGLLAPTGPGMNSGALLDHVLATLTLEHALYLR